MPNKTVMTCVVRNGPRNILGFKAVTEIHPEHEWRVVQASEDRYWKSFPREKFIEQCMKCGEARKVRP